MNRSDAAGFGLFTAKNKTGHVKPALATLLAGGLQGTCVAWPWQTDQLFHWLGLTWGQPLWWGQLLAMAMLVVLLLDSHSARQAAWRGWLFALAWLVVSVGWLYVSMHVYGGLPGVLAVLAVLALAGTLALYYAGACALFWLLAAKTVPGLRCCLLVFGCWPNWRGASCLLVLVGVLSVMRILTGHSRPPLGG
jgi:apolipoprotein N-acyltransferase